MKFFRQIRKNSILIIGLFLLGGFWPVGAGAYDDDITHPGIAEEAVQLYNARFDPDITPEQLNRIKQGATNEDTPTRWLNHFYDPVYHRGFSDLGWLGIFTDFAFPTAWEWLNSPPKQLDYALGDRSWQRGLQDYADGEEALAWQELGHSIHLLSDMAVPAHTRDSAHPGDSYENFVKHNWSAIRDASVFEFKEIQNLGDAFLTLAHYSNNNFYSERTIESEKYQIIKINKFYNFLDPTGHDKFLIALSDKNIKVFSVKGSDWNNKTLDKEVDSSLILSDYASHLIPQAVNYSSGMIKLFIEEGEKLKQEQAQMSRWQKILADGLPLIRISQAGVLNRIFGWVVSLGEFVWESSDIRLTEAPVFTPPEDLQTLTLANWLPPEDTPPNPPQTPTNPPDTAPDASQAPTVPQVSSDLEDAVNTPPPPLQEVLGENIAEEPVEEPNNDILTPSLPGSTPGFNPPPPTTTPPETPTDTPPPTTTPVVLTHPAPLLDATFNNTIFTSTSAIDFFGTVATATARVDAWHRPDFSLDKEVILLSGPATVSSTVWWGSWPLTTTTNCFKFTAVNDQGVTSSLSLGALVVYDTQPPDIFLTTTSATLATHTIQLSVEYISPDSDLLDYELAWRRAGGEWQTIGAEITATVFTTTTRQSGIYEWQVRARDLAGNYSAWATTAVSAPVLTHDYIYLNGTQAEDELILTALAGPYILQDYIVPAGKRLVIEPGTMIKSEISGRLTIHGELLAQGASDAPIIFTVLPDQTFNDDILDAGQLGPAEDPLFRYWRGLNFSDNSSGVLSDVEIRYSGEPDMENFMLARYECGFSQSIFANRARLTLTRVAFNQAGQTAICALSSEVVLTDSVLDGFEDTPDRHPMIPGYDGVWAVGGNLTLRRVEFKNYSRWPLVLNNAVSEITDVTFTDNLFNSGLTGLEQTGFGGIFQGDDFYLVAGQSIDAGVLAGWDLTNIKKIYLMYQVSWRGDLTLTGTADAPLQIISVSEYGGMLNFTGGQASFTYAEFFATRPNLQWFSLTGLGGRGMPDLYGWEAGQSVGEYLENNQEFLMVVNEENNFISIYRGTGVAFSHCRITMPAIPVLWLIYNQDGRVVLTDTVLAWDAEGAEEWAGQATLPLTAIYSVGGQIGLANTEIKNFYYGVYSDYNQGFGDPGASPDLPENFPEIIAFDPATVVFTDTVYPEYPAGVLFGVGD